MQFSLLVTDDAENDIEQAMDYYESKQVGLGSKFILSVKACIKSIVRNPFAFITIYQSIRKSNLKKFPYSLYYRIDEAAKLIIIFAVIHGYRSDQIREQRMEDILND